MSTLAQFLAYKRPEKFKEITLPGNEQLTVKIKRLDTAEIAGLRAEAVVYKTVGNNAVEQFNTRRFKNSLIVAALVAPKLNSAEVTEAYEVADPLLVPELMFTNPADYDAIWEAAATFAYENDENEPSEEKQIKN